MVYNNVAGNAVELTSVSVSPTSQTYHAGDTFHKSQYTVTAYYSDGTSKDVTSSASYSLGGKTVSDGDFLSTPAHQSSEYTLSVSFAEDGITKFATGSVTVVGVKSISVIPSSNSYTTGDTFHKSDYLVRVDWSDGIGGFTNSSYFMFKLDGNTLSEGAPVSGYGTGKTLKVTYPGSGSSAYGTVSVDVYARYKTKKTTGYADVFTCDDKSYSVGDSDGRAYFEVKIVIAAGADVGLDGSISPSAVTLSTDCTDFRIYTGEKQSSSYGVAFVDEGEVELTLSSANAKVKSVESSASASVTVVFFLKITNHYDKKTHNLKYTTSIFGNFNRA